MLTVSPFQGNRQLLKGIEVSDRAEILSSAWRIVSLLNQVRFSLEVIWVESAKSAMIDNVVNIGDCVTNLIGDGVMKRGQSKNKSPEKCCSLPCAMVWRAAGEAEPAQQLQFMANRTVVCGASMHTKTVALLGRNGHYIHGDAMSLATRKSCTGGELFRHGRRPLGEKQMRRSCWQQTFLRLSTQQHSKAFGDVGGCKSNCQQYDAPCTKTSHVAKDRPPPAQQCG